MGNEDFEHIRVIGKGSYGEVWLAKHKKDKKQYVLKKMNLCKASKRERKSAEQEAKLLSKLKHPNIVSYKDSFETDGGFLYIAMQYCEGGDLYARLKEQKGVPLEEQQVVEWFVQISMALQYMHERNILHRDLKTQNIFLTKSKIIKVGDLGIARILDNASDMATTLIGTPYYMSPELFTNKPYNHKSDVWALGCCVYEMTTLKHAFNAIDMNSLVYKILKGRMPPMPRQYSSDLLTLMRTMLHQNPEKRPSVNRILRDPYIKKNIAVFLENTKKNSQRVSHTPASQAAMLVSRSSSVPSSKKNSTSDSLEAGPGQVLKSARSQKPQITQDRQETTKKMASHMTEGSQHKNFLLDHVENNIFQQSEQEFQTPEQREKPNDLKKPPPYKTKDSNSFSKPQTPEDSVVKMYNVRKPSDSAQFELASVKGKNEEPVKSFSDECMWKIQVPSVVKEAVSSKKEIAQHKKNFLWNRIKNGKSGQKEIEPQVDLQQKKADVPGVAHGQMNESDRNTPEPHKQYLKSEDEVRPIPVPSVKSSAGLPEHREERHADSFRSSSISTSVEDNSRCFDGETPRSLPNLSARQRRRQLKNYSAGSCENPNSARIKLRRVPDSVTKSDKEKLPAEGQYQSGLKPARQPSLTDSTSSSDDSQKLTNKESAEEREAKRESKEMNNFISVLDTTLQMNAMIENSEEEEELVPIEEESPHSEASLSSLSQQVSRDQQIYKSVSMPSVETLTNTSRLMDRIRILHRDCIKGVGYIALKKAYEILNKIDEDEVEPKLVDLLGKVKFDEYAGKIWQLKFCEECLFEIS